MRTPHANPLPRLPHAPHKNHRIQRPRHSPLPRLIPINARHAPGVAAPARDYWLRVIGFVDDDFSGRETDGKVFVGGGGKGEGGYGGWVRDGADFLEGEVVHVLGGVVAADGDVGGVCGDDGGRVACGYVFDYAVVFLGQDGDAFVGGCYDGGGCGCYTPRLAVCFGGGASEGLGGRVDGSEGVVPAYAVDATSGRGETRDVILMSVALDRLALACAIEGADTSTRVTSEEAWTRPFRRV